MECIEVRVGILEKVGIGCAGEIGVNRMFGPCNGNSASTGVLGSIIAPCARRFFRRTNNETRARRTPMINSTPTTIPTIIPVEGPTLEAGRGALVEIN